MNIFYLSHTQSRGSGTWKTILTGICLPVLLFTPTAPPPALAHLPATVTVDREPIVIDLNTVLTVLHELRSPIEDAIQPAKSLLPDANRFTITALRTAEDWMHAILIPTYVVE